MRLVKTRVFRFLPTSVAVAALLVSPATPAAATPPGLACTVGWDQDAGWGRCENKGTTSQTFWVRLDCVHRPDVNGNQVTVRPGQSGLSVNDCPGKTRGVKIQP